MKYISLILSWNFNQFHKIVFDIISVLDLIRYENSTSSLIAFTYHMLNINVTYCIFDDLFNLMQQNHHNITQQRSTQLTPTKLDFSFFPEETLIQTENSEKHRHRFNARSFGVCLYICFYERAVLLCPSYCPTPLLVLPIVLVVVIFLSSSSGPIRFHFC